MFDIVLHEPEIPGNTGNIIRLCANGGFRLHLIEPLGFALDAARLRRAGLDYHEYAALKLWPTLADFRREVAPARLFACSTQGRQVYAAMRYRPGDAFVFGAETRGLPPSIREGWPDECLIRIPMRPGSRSLNLSNAVAIVAYEAWRQQGFTAS